MGRGVIALSTGNVLERLRVAHDLGFRAFQVSLPSWSELTDAEVLTYLTTVCGAFPDSQFMHYNTARVGRIVSGSLYRHIVDQVPNLVATKTMTPNLRLAAGLGCRSFRPPGAGHRGSRQRSRFLCNAGRGASRGSAPRRVEARSRWL